MRWHPFYIALSIVLTHYFHKSGDIQKPLNHVLGHSHAMAILLLILFLAMVAVDIWAAVVVIFQHRLSRWLRSSYVVITLLAFVAAFVVTSFFSYYANPNTHVFGWPVPRVIFQRDTPTSPWLDYVGPTILLAYPMNFVIYLSIPSVVFVVLAMRWRRHDHETVA